MTAQGLDHLSTQQREAVLASEGPVLILAGAGSGKTRVITHRISHLLESSKARPWEILALTFTNKAAREMKERAGHLTGLPTSDLWVTTFHAFGVRILRRYAQVLGYDPSFVIYDSDDSARVVKRLFKEKAINESRLSVSGFLGWMDRRSWSGSGPASDSYVDRRYAELFDDYQAFLKKSNAVDFKDLLHLPLILFQQHEEVRLTYQQRFRYIMVDEYQDTNPTQYRLVRILAEHHRNLTAVGDEDQSIYSWRGADIRNILDFERDFPDTRMFHLTENYRSPQVVLDAANALIRHNEETHRKTEGLVAARDTEGDRLRYYLAGNDDEEAQWVVHTINELVTRGVDLDRMAIFYRTHAQSRKLEERLIRTGIPFRVFGGIPFFAKKEVKDLLAYMRVIANPKDDLNLARAILVPRRGIGETTLEKAVVEARTRGLSLVEALETGAGLAAGTRKKIQAFLELLAELRGLLAHTGLHQLVTILIDRIDYRVWLVDQGREDRDEIVDEFVRMVAEYDVSRSVIETGGSRPALDAFLEGIALYDAVETLRPGARNLTMMTVHNAKGLEFDYVFIVGLEERLFPHANSLESPLDLEEERRLFYVGITRTMQRLFLTSARMRNMRGYPEVRTPSRFLQEIDPRTLEVRSVGGWVPATRFSREAS